MKRPGKKLYRTRLLRAAFAIGGRLAPRWTSQRALNFFLRTEHYPRPAREVEYLQGARRLVLKNKLIAYVWGHSGGPRILLVHGWNGRGSQLGAFAAPLVAQGYEVIALDGPAHGESPGTAVDVGTYSATLVETGQELGPLRAIIAHSFGAGCSLLAVRQGLKTEKLVLIASPGAYEDVVTHFAQHIRLPERARTYFHQRLTQLVGLSPEELHIGKLGAAVTLPTLLVHDENDIEVPFANAVTIQAHWPNSELFSTHGQGHRRILRHAPAIEKITQFIGRIEKKNNSEEKIA